MINKRDVNVFIVGGPISGKDEYSRLFTQNGFKIVSILKEADLACFTGGEDVSPHLYDEPKHPTTHNSLIRDAYEGKLFSEAFALDIPMVGICRGGQFLNVMSGGKMYQDVSRHTNYHPIYDKVTNKRIYASSTHHQMMRPGVGAEVVAVAYEEARKEFMEITDGEAHISQGNVKEDDIEVLFYKDTQCLCFQPHPEFESNALAGLKEYFFDLLARHFNI